MPDEERVVVVARVHESAGDVVGGVGSDSTGGRVERIHAVDLHLELTSCLGRPHSDIRLAEHHEQVAGTGLSAGCPHCEIWVHAHQQDLGLPHAMGGLSHRKVGASGGFTGGRDGGGLLSRPLCG